MRACMYVCMYLEERWMSVLTAEALKKEVCVHVYMYICIHTHNKTQIHTYVHTHTYEPEQGVKHTHIRRSCDDQKSLPLTEMQI